MPLPRQKDVRLSAPERRQRKATDPDRGETVAR
jgi:hypothetical protein